MTPEKLPSDHKSGSFKEAARRASNGATTSKPMEHMNGNSSYVTVPCLPGLPRPWIPRPTALSEEVRREILVRRCLAYFILVVLYGFTFVETMYWSAPKKIFVVFNFTYLMAVSNMEIRNEATIV